MPPLTNPSAQDDADFTDSGFFLLRTPLLPIQEFLKLSAPAAVASQNEDESARSTRALAREHFRAWVDLPEVREALWIASPEFVQSLGVWRDEPESAKGLKIQQALYRYMARMCARATPFGAFAGCTLGTIADVTRLELGARSQYRRSTRLDMEYLCSLAEHLAADPARRSGLRFRLNTTLHRAAGRYHHVRGDWYDGSRVFQLVVTETSPALEATLARAAFKTMANTTAEAAAGATAGALVAALMEDDHEVTAAEAETFVGRLIESQILVAELVPPVTGVEAIPFMAGQLEQAGSSDLASELRGIAEALRELDRSGLGADPRAYDGIASTVSRLGGAFKPGRLVQVDVIKPAVAASLDRRLVADILEAAWTLHSMCEAPNPAALQEFIESFEERYHEREIPLLEALDDEAGVGFEGHENPGLEPLLAGIDFNPAEEAPPEEDEGTRPPSLLERRLAELREKKEIVLVLDDEIVNERRAAHPLPLPDACVVMGAVLSGREGQHGFGFNLQSVFGPSGANLLARLCHADARLAEAVQAHVKAEEALDSSGAVFAEIVHLPEGRVGNVICRPVLRRYEIPLLATPGTSTERQIALSDLTVSLRHGRVVLRSQRLGVEVLPRLTAAHNFLSARSLKLYKFLCLLQHQGTCAEVFWDWGALSQSPFLPRVTRGAIVVSPARWRLNRETALGLSQGGLPVEQWREQNLVPRFVFIAEFDHQLLIDFESPAAVETFLEHIRKQTETLLVEMFPAPDALSVQGPEGSFVHEILLPVVRKRAAPVVETPPTRAATPSAADVEWKSGTEWLFAKLYCSPSHADLLLLELVKPLVEELQSAGHIDGWFFVRYADPQWHLRLRFHGDPEVLKTRALPRLREMAARHSASGSLWRMAFDTYEPETERYGGAAAIGLAERFFQIDSELGLDLMEVIAKDQDAELRWHLAFHGTDRLLAGLGFTLEERRSMAEEMAESCEQSWVVDESYRKQVAARFREERKVLSGLCGGVPGLPEDALAAFRKFSNAVEGVRREMEGKLAMPMREVAVSLVHMHLNRVLRTSHRAQETTMYNFLARTYAGRLAANERE